MLTDEQRLRLIECYEDPDITLAYWNSDPWGRSANGGSTDPKWHAAPGVVQTIDEDLHLRVCPIGPGEGGLHGTKHPHRWKGQRVWVVALFNKIPYKQGKMVARKREIICELTPDSLLTPQLAVRMGVFLSYLSGADLHHAHLPQADLRRANLRRANLCQADLRLANLRRAYLSHANLRRADLHRANLRRADLRGADLHLANLCQADLRRANLHSVNLHSADLHRANLHHADLRGADLRYAKLPTYYEPPASAKTI